MLFINLRVFFYFIRFVFCTSGDNIDRIYVSHNVVDLLDDSYFDLMCIQHTTVLCNAPAA